jgi:hypothetical protein
MQQVIGTETTYLGHKFPFMHGQQVRIVAVIKPDAYLKNDRDLAEAGEVSADDRIEVQPRLPDGRWSWVTSDPQAADLACFTKHEEPPGERG